MQIAKYLPEWVPTWLYIMLLDKRSKRLVYIIQNARTILLDNDGHYYVCKVMRGYVNDADPEEEYIFWQECDNWQELEPQAREAYTLSNEEPENGKVGCPPALAALAIWK